MKNLSKFELGMIIAFVVVLILGVAGWWYTGTMAEDAQKRMTSLNRQKQTLMREEYTPAAATVTTLEKNIEAINAAIKPIEDQILQPDEDALGQIQPMVPSVWKQQKLIAAVKEMQATAGKKAIKLPTKDYYFGFDRYIANTPAAGAIINLTKQLIGIKTAFDILMDAGGVKEIVAIRRTYDEDGRLEFSRGTMTSTSLAGRGAGTGASDRLKLNVEKPLDGLYEVFPLEFEFVSDPGTVSRFLNGLSKSKILFVVRSVSTNTTPSISPLMSELKQQYDRMEKKTRPIPFGQERVTAKVRFDMIDWLGAAQASADENTDEPAEGTQRQAQR